MWALSYSQRLCYRSSLERRRKQTVMPALLMSVCSAHSSSPVELYTDIGIISSSPPAALRFSNAVFGSATEPTLTTSTSGTSSQARVSQGTVRQTFRRNVLIQT